MLSPRLTQWRLAKSVAIIVLFDSAHFHGLRRQSVGNCCRFERRVANLRGSGVGEKSAWRQSRQGSFTAFAPNEWCHTRWLCMTTDVGHYRFIIYLSTLLPFSDICRTLRSSVSKQRCNRPFSVAAPMVWHQLSITIKSSEIIYIFHKKLNSYLLEMIKQITVTINFRRFQAPMSTFACPRVWLAKWFSLLRLWVWIF